MKKQRLYFTDLAVERRQADLTVEGVKYKKEDATGGVWEYLHITSVEGARTIGRPIGHYDTLTVMKMDDMDLGDIDDAKEEVARELCRLFAIEDITPDRILVVGLGNPDLTPDALGPRTAGRVEATMHIKAVDEDMFYSLECSEIGVITPGVRSRSGIDTAEMILGTVRVVRPDAVIVIDSLAARSVERLGRTIQFSTTGIQPASGVGMHRIAIDETLLRVPVISVGVPTIIDSALFSGRGEAGDDEGMLVSPREISEIIDKAAEIIGGGINQAFGIFL